MCCEVNTKKITICFILSIHFNLSTFAHLKRMLFIFKTIREKLKIFKIIDRIYMEEPYYYLGT